ncbi:MAG: hypothetical protein Q8891_17595 [Bacteroidota bacterium]|nr:hypothetical protein [Bacteroidota bacterium]
MKEVHEFNFSSFDSDKEVIGFTQLAREILRTKLPKYLLFDEACDGK